VAGARLLRAFGGAKMAASAEEALVKINAVLPDTARARSEAVQVHAINAEEMTPELRNRIDQIEAAVNAQLLLHMAYADEDQRPSQRVVRPLGLWFWGKVWTLVSWCELRQDFRMFRIDRIQTLQEGDRFKPLPGQTLRDFYRRDACWDD
ncbi:MAG: WYL domain-containing protein, partial [Pseudomonadota bacterium]|nr:WYL domain-containing protein [Pseudomonadota bacterium]